MHRILIVGPESQRKDTLLTSFEEAGFVVVSAVTIDGELTDDSQRWHLVLVLGDATGMHPLLGCSTPIIVVPEGRSAQEVLALINPVAESGPTPGRSRYDDTIVRELLATTPDYLSFKDLRGRFTRISASLVLRWGLDRPEDAIGKSDFDFYPREQAQAFFDEEQRMIRGGPHVINRLARYPRPDGRVDRVLVTKIPLRDSDGTVTGTYGVGRNVTELLEAEDRVRALLDEKEILLREIHHRVKNDFGLIRSLLLLEASQLTHDEATAALHEAASRVAVMARTYDQINVRGNPTSVAIRPLVEELFRETVESAAVRVSVQTLVDEAEAPPRVAVALGIVLNELCTNAMKHAFEGVDEPSMTVTIRCFDEERFTVRFVDNGRGFDAAVLSGSKRGHGLSIVEALLQQYGGELGMTNDHGAVVEFSLDMA